MGKKTYFLSDLHLGAPYFPDSKESEKRIVSFLDHIKDEAEQIFLLGDIMDYWFEYRYVVPRGFVRFFGKLAELSDSGIKITWIIGNHDIWIFDYLPSEIGIKVVDGYIIETLYGKKVFMAHGDGLGKQPLSFRFIRSIFRNKICQKLYSGLHPRWTVPFAYNWSRHSRKKGEGRGAPDWKLLESLKSFSTLFYEEEKNINFFIFGHVHVMAEEKIAENCKMIVLGEWIKTFSYAIMDEKGLILRKWH